MEDLKHFIEALGTPAGVAGVLSFCLWRMSKWAAPMIETVVSKHSEFIDSTSKLQSSLNDKVDAVHKDLSIHSLNTNTKLDQIKADLSAVIKAEEEEEAFVRKLASQMVNEEEGSKDGTLPKASAERTHYQQ